MQPRKRCRNEPSEDHKRSEEGTIRDAGCYCHLQTTTKIDIDRRLKVAVASGVPNRSLLTALVILRWLVTAPLSWLHSSGFRPGSVSRSATLSLLLKQPC